MGWYVTCETCGAQEKYSHPSCGCIQRGQKQLLKKMIGAIVIDNFILYADFGYSYLYTHYSKIAEEKKIEFYTCFVLTNGPGEHEIPDTFYEVSFERFDDAKSEMTASENKESNYDEKDDSKEIKEVINKKPMTSNESKNMDNKDARDIKTNDDIYNSK